MNLDHLTVYKIPDLEGVKKVRTTTFRAWHKERKQMSWDYGINPEKITFYDPKDELCCEELNYDKHSWQLIDMQYLDLKDSKGEMLCFDDIVEIVIGGRVEKFLKVCTLQDYVELFQYIYESGARFKIVGNIHENPYLR